MQTQTPVLLTTIKGTAMNKGRARVWVESADLAKYGLARGTRISITFEATAIIVAATPEGKRKVAGREKNGRTICILDICFDAAQRDAMFNGADRLAVFAADGHLVVKAA